MEEDIDVSEEQSGVGDQYNALCSQLVAAKSRHRAALDEERRARSRVNDTQNTLNAAEKAFADYLRAEYPEIVRALVEKA